MSLRDANIFGQHALRVRKSDEDAAFATSDDTDGVDKRSTLLGSRQLRNDALSHALRIKKNAGLALKST